MKSYPLNCYRCGRWVGKDGDPDISHAICDEPAEIGYPRCGRCVREDDAGRAALSATPAAQES